MSMPEDDQFEKLLDEHLAKLQECQKEKQVQSCSTCTFYIGCEIRDEYVRSVYSSMSKGQIGGFEF